MTRPRPKGRVSIATMLLVMNLVVLVLPLSSLWMLRLYESALIRQTESELIAQAGVVAAFYRSAWRGAGGRVEAVGAPVDARWTRLPGFDAPWLPRFAGLDLAETEVLPAAPDPTPAAVPAEPAALRAGADMTAVLRDAQRMTLAAMRVMDHHGVVVATTGEDAALSLAEQEEVARALTGEPVSLLRRRISHHVPAESLGLLERSRALRLFVAQPVLEEDRVVGVVLVSRTPRTIADALMGKKRHLAVLAVLLVASVAGMVRLGTVSIARPLRAVTAQAKRTADGERGAVAPMDRPMLREVAELSEALTRMAATLEQRADYIRDFAAHVSHEFKTPLTTIRGSVELLRDHLETMAPEERDRFLANMDAEAERLSRLVQRLLDLARADVMGVAEGGTCRPAEIATQLAERYRATGLEVDVQVTDAGVAAMGREALETVLANLLDNARQHAGPGAKVTIAVGKAHDGIFIRVADTGPGISPANAERIFTPFFTTARKRGGTGLGLAIVDTLVTAHGGTIAVVPSENGAVFDIHVATDRT